MRCLLHMCKDDVLQTIGIHNTRKNNKKNLKKLLIINRLRFNDLKKSNNIIVVKNLGRM